jgi:hypothetical protein
LAASRHITDAIELGAAKLVSSEYLGTAACSVNRCAIERDGVVAGTDQDFWWPVGHFFYLTIVLRCKIRLGTNPVWFRSQELPPWRTGVGDFIGGNYYI